MENGIKAEENGSSVKKEWKMLKRLITSVGQDTLGFQKTLGRKPWMTENILQLMDQHRKYILQEMRDANNCCTTSVQALKK